MMMRDFAIDTLTERDDLGPSWQEVVGERKINYVASCEFGMAEEVIALISFADGTYEVGIGESLRPYLTVYEGDSALDAQQRFLHEVLDHARVDEPVAFGPEREAPEGCPKCRSGFLCAAHGGRDEHDYHIPLTEREARNHIEQAHGVPPTAKTYGALVNEHREIHKPWLGGYSRTITSKLAAVIHANMPATYERTPMKEVRRGTSFEVTLVDADGPTTHVATVSIKLDRVEQSGKVTS